MGAWGLPSPSSPLVPTTNPSGLFPGFVNAAAGPACSATDVAVVTGTADEAGAAADLVGVRTGVGTGEGSAESEDKDCDDCDGAGCPARALAAASADPWAREAPPPPPPPPPPPALARSASGAEPNSSRSGSRRSSLALGRAAGSRRKQRPRKDLTSGSRVYLKHNAKRAEKKRNSSCKK